MRFKKGILEDRERSPQREGDFEKKKETTPRSCVQEGDEGTLLIGEREEKNKKKIIKLTANPATPGYTGA